MANQIYTYNNSKMVTGTSANDKDAIDVSENHNPAYRSSFGDFTSESLDPVTQISAQYGILNTVETFTATGGTVTTPNNMFTCSTTTSVGSYAVCRTRFPTIYREGAGLMSRFTALFDSNAVANSLQFAGLFNVQDTIAFGYRGTDFGIIFDHYGAQEIQKLEITAATSGNLSLTLNSVLYTIPLTAGTNAHNAYEIETWMEANQSIWDTEQVGDFVFFRNKNAAAAAGTYSFSGAGVTGTLSQEAEGLAKTEETILEADWNGEAVSFDKTKGNIYMIKVSYLGFGPISFFIMDENEGIFKRVHTIKYQNNNTRPSISNRALKVGWTAASLGSTTALTVQGASASTFIEGTSRLTSLSHAQENSNTAVGTTFEAVLTLRVFESFKGKAFMGRVVLQRLAISTDSTKEVIFKVSKNATLGQTNYSYHDEEDSVVTYDTGNHADTGNAHSYYGGQIGASGATEVDLKSLNIELLSTDTLTIFAKVVSGSASDVTATITWKEDT